MTMEERIIEILKNPTVTYRQRVLNLAKAAEDVLPAAALSKEAEWFREQDVIFDMNEGNAPFRPRYIVPNYDLFMKQGSDFLSLPAPTDIRQAVDALLILYHHVPSSGGDPMYIGHIDRLLEPFIEDEQEARDAIRALLTHVDRTIADSFCQANVGPYDTRAGRIILEVTAEMNTPVPNMSIIYDEEKTSDDFAIAAVRTNLICSKPAFANDRIYCRDWGEQYAIASCYNAFPLGGGGLTLGRLNMKALGALAQNPQQLLDELLPRAIAAQCEQMDRRIQFIIDDCTFFEHSFLVDEGLIERDKFVGMFGMTGMAECVNSVLQLVEPSERYGSGEQATAYTEQILEIMDREVRAYRPKYNRFYLHAQVGIDTDFQCTPNVRVPVGEEPSLIEQIRFAARVQKPFTTGVGELFAFEETAVQNPEAVLDVIKAAFRQDMRYFAPYRDGTDVIRVTGYLIKRSDLEKMNRGEVVLNSGVGVGRGALDSIGALNRKVYKADGLTSLD